MPKLSTILLYDWYLLSSSATSLSITTVNTGFNYSICDLRNYKTLIYFVLHYNTTLSDCGVLFIFLHEHVSAFIPSCCHMGQCQYVIFQFCTKWNLSPVPRCPDLSAAHFIAKCVFDFLSPQKSFIFVHLKMN